MTNHSTVKQFFIKKFLRKFFIKNVDDLWYTTRIRVASSPSHVATLRSNFVRSL